MDIQKRKEKYLKCSHRCLICDSEDIEGSSVEIDADSASQEIHCNECESSWTDVYRLEDVENICIESGGDKND